MPKQNTIRGMIRRPDHDEELDPTEWYGKTKITATDWLELWGIPDWRDESAYPQKVVEGNKPPRNHVELSQDQWRWEFLRRDTDYREDYEACCNGALRYKVCEGTDPNLVPQKPRGRKNKDGAPPLLYDMASIVDPRHTWRDMPKKIFLRRHEGKQIPTDGTVDVPGLLTNPRYCLMVYDVHRPLAEQIERAQSHLFALQGEADKAQQTAAKRRGRSQHRRGDVGEHEVITTNRLSDDFRHMLRLVDAIMDKAKIAEIGEILYGATDYNKAQTKMNKERAKALSMWHWL